MNKTITEKTENFELNYANLRLSQSFIEQAEEVWGTDMCSY
jgi:hypothetical protein